MVGAAGRASVGIPSVEWAAWFPMRGLLPTSSRQVAGFGRNVGWLWPRPDITRQSTRTHNSRRRLRRKCWWSGHFYVIGQGAMAEISPCEAFACGAVSPRTSARRASGSVPPASLCWGAGACGRAATVRAAWRWPASSCFSSKLVSSLGAGTSAASLFWGGGIGARPVGTSAASLFRGRGFGVRSIGTHRQWRSGPAQVQPPGGQHRWVKLRVASVAVGSDQGGFR